MDDVLSWTLTDINKENNKNITVDKTFDHVGNVFSKTIWFFTYSFINAYEFLPIKTIQINLI